MSLRLSAFILIFLIPVFSLAEPAPMAAIAMDAGTTVSPTATTPPVVEGFKGSADAGMGLIKMTVGLLFVLALIFASAWFFRRFTNIAVNPNNAVRIVAGISIGHRERIVVVQVGDEQVMVGVTPGRIDALHVLNVPIQTADEGQATGGNFAEKLQLAMKQWKAK